ncbi:hypothetical protein [Helicobacter sp.]|uniref:hypothetical protein n=1 Tax=Helicobacter sp. TaxID=218 RepID=UPI002A74A95F|nr:hypothetical protein [Helicobacter sp.]MDY2584083.1 hypothetical protein [Helicobacter sp.]
MPTIHTDSATTRFDSATSAVFSDSATTALSNGSNVVFHDSAFTQTLKKPISPQEQEEKLQSLLKLKEQKQTQLESLQQDYQNAQEKGDVLSLIRINADLVKIEAEIKYLESVIDNLLHLEEIPYVSVNQEIIDSLSDLPEFVAKVHQTLLLTQDSHNAILYLLGYAKNGVDLIADNAKSVVEKYAEFQQFYAEISSERAQDLEALAKIKVEMNNLHASLNTALINKDEILGKLVEAKEVSQKLQDLLNEYAYTTNNTNNGISNGISEDALNAFIGFANTSLGAQAKLSLELIQVFERLDKLERK